VNFENAWPSVTLNGFFQGMPYMKMFNMKISADPKFVFSLSQNKFSAWPKAIKILFASENFRPNMKCCDWGFGFDYEEDVNNRRYMRIPSYVRLGAGNDLIKHKQDIRKGLEAKTKFCAFVYSHYIPVRLNFFKKLSKYKRIDAPGRLCNNVPPIGKCRTPEESRRVPGAYRDKIDFFRSYKFAIVFENSSYPGYTDEKIYHAFLAGCIPIYWGNPHIGREFNSRSFIHPYDRDHKNLDSMLDYLVQKIEYFDKNDDAYLRMFSEPWLIGNVPNKWMNKDRIISRFKEIFSV